MKCIQMYFERNEDFLSSENKGLTTQLKIFLKLKDFLRQIKELRNVSPSLTKFTRDTHKRALFSLINIIGQMNDKLEENLNLIIGEKDSNKHSKEIAQIIDFLYNASWIDEFLEQNHSIVRDKIENNIKENVIILSQRLKSIQIEIKRPQAIFKINQTYQTFSKISDLLKKDFPFIQEEFVETIKIIDNSLSINIFDQVETLSQEPFHEKNFRKFSDTISIF